MESQSTLFEDADAVMDDAINSALYSSNPVVVVKSPPGAGKTFLVECAAAAAASSSPQGMRVVIVTPGVSQLYDVAERLLHYALRRVEVVHAKHRSLPENLVGRVQAFNGWDSNLNCGPGVVVTNAHLLAAYLEQLGQNAFDLMILDEAYQLSASTFLPIAGLAPRVLMVGDPGQLDPVCSVDTSNLEIAKHKMHWSAPAYVLDRFPLTPVFGLPVTRRLLPDSADVVQKAFYPDLPFKSVVSPGARRLHFGISGIESGIDDALDAVASGASIVAVTVPGTSPFFEEADPDVARVMAQLAERALIRQASWLGERVLTESDIGCIDPHVISGGAIGDSLRQRGLNGIRVDTVERWQGLQLPIAIVRHPLSMAGEPTAFELEAGRWCVSLSRHLIGCIIVARESVEARIDNYVHGCDTAAAGARDTAWKGFEAHRTIWQQLKRQGHVFPVQLA